MAASDLALLCQRAENKFIGVNSGIMDQMAVAACHRDHALLLDCRSLAHEQVPFVLANHTVVVTDSRAPRELASSAYNERRAQCEEGVRLLQTRLPHITSLRDVSEDDLAQHSDVLPPIVLKRVQHVVGEIARTISAVASLKAGDLPAFGLRMQESHASLRHLYEVTSPELDWLTDWSNSQPGVLGSRMTGAGFGGCTVTLIENGAVKDYTTQLPQEYQQAMGREARCLVCTASEGAQVLNN
jgi:galactokinase